MSEVLSAVILAKAEEADDKCESLCFDGHELWGWANRVSELELKVAELEDDANQLCCDRNGWQRGRNRWKRRAETAEAALAEARETANSWERVARARNFEAQQAHELVKQLEVELADCPDRAALAVAQEQTARGERLWEAVQARPPALSATAWRTWAKMARAMPWPELTDCCEAIASALEAEDQDGTSTGDPDDLANRIIVDDMERREGEEPEPPCAHEAGVWHEERPVGRPRGWWARHQCKYFGSAGEDCKLCGKPFPPKP